MGKPFWTLIRCKRCIFYDKDNICLRDYPRTTIERNCKIRMYRKAPWRDAFIKRSSLLDDLSFLGKVEPLQNKLTHAEKKRRIEIYLGAYIQSKTKINKE